MPLFRRLLSFALAVSALAAGCTNAHSAPISCVSSRECSSAGLVCDLDAQLCVQCVAQTDCLGEDEVCMQHECVQVTHCVSSRECPGLVCDPVAGFCVECVVDLDCGAENRCVDHSCEPRPTPCASDGVCIATNQVCDVEAGVCVDCVRDADCPTGTRCEADHTCQPGERDAGSIDSGAMDAGLVDAWIEGPTDASTFDASPVPDDASVVDASAIDASSVDAGTVDAFTPPIDAGPGVVYGVTGFRADYTVPAGVTRVLIVAEGASGGHATGLPGVVWEGGFGARVSSIVSVTPGETLSVVVGDQPAIAPYGADGCGGSGGGGSFVVRGSMTALVVAGGGGGGSAFGPPRDGGDASLTSDGASSGSLAGGGGGLGGSAVSHEGGGGGGLIGSGHDGIGIGGAAYVFGSAGGARDSTEGCGTATQGGFGGGGGGGNDWGAGGGGYSGGAGQGDAVTPPSGGGGSYASGTSTSITLRTTHGPGSVTITAL